MPLRKRGYLLVALMRISKPVSPYTVMRELGHRSLKLIEETYGHLQQIRHRSSVVEYREVTVTPIAERRRA